MTSQTSKTGFSNYQLPNTDRSPSDASTTAIISISNVFSLIPLIICLIRWLTKNYANYCRNSHRMCQQMRTYLSRTYHHLSPHNLRSPCALRNNPRTLCALIPTHFRCSDASLLDTRNKTKKLQWNGKTTHAVQNPHPSAHFRNLDTTVLSIPASLSLP